MKQSRFSRTRPARDVHGATFLALTTGGELRDRFPAHRPAGGPAGRAADTGLRDLDHVTGQGVLPSPVGVPAIFFRLVAAGPGLDL